MTDLDKLIEAVEGGEMESPPIGKVFGFSWKTKWASAAYHGSLDAAKELHEALLPGWDWVRMPSGNFVLLEGRGAISYSRGYRISHTGVNYNHARAWLIAILKAYRAQQEANQ